MKDSDIRAGKRVLTNNTRAESTEARCAEGRSYYRRMCCSEEVEVETKAAVEAEPLVRLRLHKFAPVEKEMARQRKITAGKWYNPNCGSISDPHGCFVERTEKGEGAESGAPEHDYEGQERTH